MPGGAQPMLRRRGARGGAGGGRSFERFGRTFGGGGGGGTTHSTRPHTPLKDGARFFLCQAFGQSIVFFGAFGTSQFRPETFFGASTNSAALRRGLQRGGGGVGATRTPATPSTTPSTTPSAPTTGPGERGNDTTRNTGRSGRQNAATRRNMRRGERVTVQAP